MEKRINLMKALLEVRKATGAVLKSGTNEFHRYAYATANDVMKMVRDHMNEAGIITAPVEQKDFISTKEGKVEEFTQVYEVCHVDSGESMLVSIRTAGEDAGDKKAFKANTGALKYLFIQLFLLPTDDDPENDAKGKGNQGQKQQQPAKGTAPAAPEKPWLNENTKEFDAAMEYMKSGKGTIDAIKKKYKLAARTEARLKGEWLNGTVEPPDPAEKPWLNKGSKEWDEALALIKAKGKVAEHLAGFRISKENMAELRSLKTGG